MLHIAGTGAGNDISGTEGATINSHAVEIAAFVNSGGGLLAHGSGSSAFGWLATVLPGFEFGGPCENDDATLTPAGALAFPLITDANIQSGPCHDSFSGNFGGLDILAFDSTPAVDGGPFPFIMGVAAGLGTIELKIPETSEMLMFSSQTSELANMDMQVGPLNAPFGSPIVDVCNNVGQDFPSSGSPFIVPPRDVAPNIPGFDPDPGTDYKPTLDIDPNAEWISTNARPNFISEYVTCSIFNVKPTPCVCSITSTRKITTANARTSISTMIG